MQLLQDIFHQFFSTLDFKSGYWHISVNPWDRQTTAQWIVCVQENVTSPGKRTLYLSNNVGIFQSMNPSFYTAEMQWSTSQIILTAQK